MQCSVDQEPVPVRQIAAFPGRQALQDHSQGGGGIRVPDISIGRFRGGFCVYWHDGPTRRRYQLAARSRKEAEAEAIDTYRRHHFRPAGQTVTDIWEAYRADLGAKPTAETMGYTGKAVLAHFGALRPDQIEKRHCLDYAGVRSAKGISQGSVHTELGHLRSAMNWARDARIIDHAPAIWRPEKPTPKERHMTPAEIGRLLDGANAPHIRLAIHILVATAARIGAVLDLTWARVDLERGQLNFRLDDSVTRKGRAIVPINAGLRAALSIAREAALTDYVVEYAGAQVSSIRTGFSAAVARAGLKDVSLHVCRHSAAVQMISSGVPIEKVAQMLGHSNTSVTYSTYARFAPDHLRDAADVLEFTGLRVVK